MNDTALLGPWVRRFLLEHLVVERNLSRQTQLSYRDALRLLLPFVAARCHQSLDRLRPEMDALLRAPDRTTNQGRRDYALLLFLFNSGARASEAAGLTIADIDLAQPSARLLGKGNKIRFCPLWSTTVQTLAPLVAQRAPTEAVFLNQCGRPITRFGIHTLVERCAQKAAAEFPSLASKRVSPHSIRHTTAVFLLRAGVDINTIRAWLGHASINTTHIYAEFDLEMKAKALAKCDLTGDTIPGKHWADDASLMAFLQSL